MKPDTVTRMVLEFVATKDEVTAAEIAAFLLDVVREELEIESGALAGSRVAKPVIWRGATSIAKDIIKRPRVVEDLLDEEEGTEQPALFDGLGAFVRVDRRDGDWRYKRRRALTQEEYRAALDLLRLKHREIADKIERYNVEYQKVLPHWLPGMTFGEAVVAATESTVG